MECFLVYGELLCSLCKVNMRAVKVTDVLLKEVFVLIPDTLEKL